MADLDGKTINIATQKWKWIYNPFEVIGMHEWNLNHDDDFCFISEHTWWIWIEVKHGNWVDDKFPM